MSVKNPDEVGRGMEQWYVRKGSDPIPSDTSGLQAPANVMHLFDKGHHRVISRVTLRNYQTDANGDYIILKGIRVELKQGPVVLMGGQLIPAGFVEVPEIDILTHFSTTYGRNIVKIQTVLQNYHRDFVTYLKDRQAGGNIGRPRRPTVKSLNLDTPSEFERYLQPLRSFHFDRLRVQFDRLVVDCEFGNDRVFQNLNFLALPNLVGGIRTDQAAVSRWNSAQNGSILVRIPDFEIYNAGNAPQYPQGQLPYPLVPFPPVPPPAAPAAPVLTPRQIDERTIERAQLGLSTKLKKTFLYMEPWMDAVPVTNPFVSPEYQQAFSVVQDGFATRHAAFKREMVRKRREHGRKWRDYAAYRNEMKSVFMLDSDRPPVNNYAERPQIENFTEEWRQFAFGLKQEMKNYEFVPVRVLRNFVAPPGFVPVYAANRERQMFLI